VLAQRRQAQQQGRAPEEALEDFRKYYMEEQESSETKRGCFMERKPSAASAWLKGLVAVAAVLVLVITSIQTASAFGYDLWDVVIQWTQETFRLGYASDIYSGSVPPEPDKEPVLTSNSLKEALSDNNADPSIVPNWIPDGYVQDEIKMVENPMQREFLAKYSSEKGAIKITVVDYLRNEPYHIEQSGEEYEVYEKDGVLYYLTKNNAETRAAWVTGSYECSISGPLSVEELKQMIDSIGKD